MRDKVNNKMRRKTFQVAIFAAVFFCGLIVSDKVVHAYNNKDAAVKYDNCKVRSEATTSSGINATLNSGRDVIVTNEKKASDGYTWYYITIKNVSGNPNITKYGWIRGDLITIGGDAASTPSSAAPASSTPAAPAQPLPNTPSNDNNFEAHLTAQGFPDSYKPYLRALHEKHPNWVFNAVNTKLDWNSVLAGETSVVSRNMVPANNIASWKSMSAGAFDYEKGNWYQYEAGWAAASKELIAYCLDPRNFLTDNQNVLMFQSLSWSDSETIDGIRAILSPTRGMNSAEFFTLFYNAGKASKVSAYHLAARADQETSGGTSRSVTGQYKNYFNINATGANPVDRAIEYAKSQGWDTPEKSIMGGAQWIGKGYFSVGQDTLYFQKFSVVNSAKLYWHQYMGNVLAPQQEAAKLAKMTSLLGSNNTVVFRIPVYSNMPATAVAVPTANGNPDNTLSSLSVKVGNQEYSLTPGFDKMKEEYGIIVPESATSVTITANPTAGTSKVEGAGSVKLTGTTTVFNIKVTPNYGSPRTYKLTIRKSENAGIAVQPSSGGSSGGTGVKKGDVNNDGVINIRDLILIKRHIVGLETLEGNELKAADVNGDGVVNARDLVVLKRFMVGLEDLD